MSLNSSRGEGEPDQAQVQLSSNILPGPVHPVLLPAVLKLQTQAHMGFLLLISSTIKKANKITQKKKK